MVQEIYRRGTKVLVWTESNGRSIPRYGFTIDNKNVDGVLMYAVQFSKSGKIYWYEEGSLDFNFQ